MSTDTTSLHLPEYDDFVEAIAVFSLNLSASTLHGMMCGYLCAGADNQGEAYIRSLSHNNKDEASRQAIFSLFSVFSISQQQMNQFNFEFEMLLPDDNESLFERAKAFSEWCEGFTQGLTQVGIRPEQLNEEDAQEALQHLFEFAELDCDSLDMEEDDENALMEISEYTRMAVIRLHNDLTMNEKERGTTH